MQMIAPSKGMARRAAVAKGRKSVVARAAATKIEKKEVPLELEEGDMPMNTYNPKKPFTAKIKSVKRIVGPKVCCFSRLKLSSNCSVIALPRRSATVRCQG